jgi:hypothetical protein
MMTASLKYMVTDAFGIGANINYTDSMDDDALPMTRSTQTSSVASA